MLKMIKLNLTVATLALALLLFGSPGAYAQSSSLQQIIDSGELKVGVMQAPPWFYKDPKGDDWSGVGVRLGKEMADTLGVKFVPVEVTWATAVAAIQSKKIDVQFIQDATPTRALAVDYPSNPLLYYALAVLADDDLSIKTWDDLNKKGMKISVSKGTTMEAYIKKHLPNAKILSFPGNSEALAAFQSHRVNAVCLFHPPLIAMRKSIGHGQIVIPKPIRASTTSVGLRKTEDKSFRDWVNTTINYYYETGETQRFYEEFLISFGVDPTTVPAIRKENW